MRSGSRTVSMISSRSRSDGDMASAVALALAPLKLASRVMGRRVGFASIARNDTNGVHLRRRSPSFTRSWDGSRGALSATLRIGDIGVMERSTPPHVETRINEHGAGD